MSDLTTQKAETSTQTDTSVNPKTGRRAGGTQALILLFVSTMPVMGAVLLSPVLPTLGHVFRAQATLVPLLLTAPSLAIALVAPFAGIMADKMGRKPLLVSSLLLYAVLGTAPLYLTSFVAILLSRLGVGVAEAAIFTCCIALLSDYFSGRKRSRVFAWQNVVLSSGALVYIVLGGFIGAGNWRAPFWLYSIALVAAAAVALLIWRPRSEQAARSNGADSSLKSFPFRRLIPIYAITFFGGLLFYLVIVETPYLLAVAGIASVAVAGLVGAVNQFGQAVGGLTFRWVARFGVERLLPIGFAIAGAGLVLVWLAPSVLLTVVGTVLTTLGCGVFVTTLQTWTVAGLPFDERGRASGGWTTALFLGNFASALVAVGLTAVLGSLAGAFGALGVAALVLAVVLGIVLRRGPQSSLVDADFGAE